MDQFSQTTSVQLSPNLPPNALQANDKEHQIALFVGAKYAKYYKEKFDQITPKKQMAGFNIAAFFLTFAWFFYRKMYAIGFGFVAMILVIGMICEYLNFTPSSMGIGISMVSGMMGNAIYKQFVEKNISKIEKLHLQTNDINTQIQKKGGTSLLAGGVTLSLMILLTVLAFMSE